MTKESPIEEAWRLAALKPTGEGTRAVKIESRTPETWAVVDDDGRRGFMVEAGHGESLGPSLQLVGRPGGSLGAEIFTFATEQGAKRALHVWCESTELWDVFTGFCEAFRSRLHEGDAIGRCFADCLSDFKRLLMPEVGEPTSALVGIVGELLILRALVQRNPRFVASWVYPSLERQDFRWGSAAIEVKTTLRSAASTARVHINALDQLEAPEAGILHLVWIRLERNPLGMVSVNLLLDEVASLLERGEATALRHRVSATNELLTLSDTRFTEAECQCFLVTPTFPKLTRGELKHGNLDAGITRVSYELDLGVAQDFQRPLQEAIDSFVQVRDSA